MVENDMQTPVAVFGAGSFGTAVAWMLSEAGHAVNLWCYEEGDVRAINETKRNPTFLSHCNLDNVTAVADEAAAVTGVQSVIVATPSFAVVRAAFQMKKALADDTPVLVLSKGLDLAGDRLLMDAVADEIGNRDRVAVLSGPNHAEELSRGAYAGAVIASSSEETARYFQQLLSNDFFRLYVSNDPTGVSLCGAAKNVVAIACGMARGMGLGDNAVSLLMTRGLAEMSRLVEACGGSRDTCLGLAGVGDLNATCNSPHSRNGMYGETFAREGVSVQEYEHRRGMVVEGAHAVRPLLDLARTHEIELPIMEAVGRLLEGESSLEETADALMGRALKSEL